MKIAVAGKGGSGKTTVSGTLARSFAGSGYDVLAIDDDDDPNLDVALGVPPDEVTPLPDDLVETVEAPEDNIPCDLTRSPAEIIADYGGTAPDGVKLLTAGSVEAGSGCFGMSHLTVIMVLSSVTEDPDEVTLVDMPNGVEHLGIGTAKDVDVMLVVVEPTYNSLETAPKTNELATELGIPDVRVVANKIRNEQDRKVVENYCNDHELELVAGVPYDDVIRHAERDGTAPIDAAADSAAVRAICDLADEIANTHGQPHRRTNR